MPKTATRTSTRPLAIVTGASSGIGLELAKQFAEHDFDLVVAAEDADLTTAARALEKLGAHVETVQVDLSTYDGVETLWDRIKSEQRPVAAAAINAGVGASGEFSTIDLRDELKVIDLNVTSTVHLAKRVVDDMVEQGGGKVLFTSSVASTMPGPYEAVYAASKSFIQSFAQALQYELKDRDITVTTLMPGATDTEFFDRAGLQDTKLGKGKKDDPALVAKQGFEALMKGKEKKVAGSVKSKAHGSTGRLLPDKAKAAMHGKKAAPGSATKKVTAKSATKAAK